MVCDMGETEDEFHFVIKCSRYNDIRLQMYNSATSIVPNFIDMPEIETFVTLMNTCYKIFAAFVTDAIKIQKEMLLCQI